GGNSPHPGAVRGTLASIAEDTEKAGVLPPAVIVVGEVAQMDLRSPKPSITVGLTGTEEFQQKLAALLDRHGLNWRPVQRGKCSPTGASIPWEALSKTTGNWLVFTSGRGVDFFFRRLVQEKADMRSLSGCRFAVIGAKTGEALAAHGIRADLCPREFTGKALAETLLGRLAPEETVYLFDSAKGSGVIPEILAEQGISCRRISLYDTVYVAVPQSEHLRYILFGSAGGVNALAEEGYELSADTTPICIGPVCAEAFERRYHRKPLVSEHIMAESMIATLLSHRKSHA
ncbi:MAG: uroporphyrinogen-III synthase, partial [Oscillospiraceae bacterium]|nr:uroporphyrinogen-III synthase [Oscillospiraceae bacterium]